MIILEINKEQDIYLSRSWFEKVVNTFYRSAGLDGKYKVSLAFVDNQKIKKLNKIYRGKNKPTDVLSFVEEVDGFISLENNYLGEIIISVLQAKKQAKEYNYSIKHEITRLLVHGLSHLIGFEHENVSIKKAQKMVVFENDMMKRLGF